MQVIVRHRRQLAAQAKSLIPVLETVLRNGRTTHLAAEPLETSPVSRRHHDLGVHVDALALAYALARARSLRVEQSPR